MTEPRHNMYCGVLADTEANARMLLEKECHFAEGDIHELIHKEPENDPEELPIYVFAVWADGGSQELLDEGEMLSLYFTIPNVQDMPYELVNG